MLERKKKIVYVVTKSNWGGAQRYVFDLATSLPQSEFEVEVALGGNGLLKEKLLANNIKTVSIPQLQRDVSFIKEIRSFFFLYKIFRERRPDIVHLNSSKAAGLGVLALYLFRLLNLLTAKSYKLQAVFTVHGWPFNTQKNWLWKMLTWLASYATALLSTDVIVLASQDFEQAKAMPGVTSKTRLVRNGIKTIEYLSRDEARAKLGLPKNVLVVGSVGELTRNKNYGGLITAADFLWKEVDGDFKLVVIGDGEEFASITERIKSDPIFNEHINFYGFKEDAYKYLKAYDIFVLPSLKEGLPYAVLEAGAAAIPIVATSVGGIPDIIEDRKTGLLVPPKDANRLASALRELLTEKETRERLGSALKKRVEKMFSFERMLTETKKLYERKLF